MRPIQASVQKQIIHELQQGKSIQKVAAQLCLSSSTVHKYSTGLKTTIPKDVGGRVSKLSTRDKTFCVRQVTKCGKSNASQVQKALKEELGVVASATTVRRALNEQGLVAMVKPSKPLLSPKNVKARLAWAKAHKDWTIDDWKRVIWSDETKINRFGSDGRHYTYKRLGERLQPKHVKQTVKHGGSSIMIWGCITYDGPGYVTKIDNTMDKVLYQKILEEDLALTMDWYDYNPRKVIFQHDNDPKHTAKTVVEYLNGQPYEVMGWPAQSPDLNPIENIWAMVKIKLFREYDAPPKGIHDLWDRVQEVWNSLGKEECQKVIETMPKRCNDVIKQKGYWIDY